MINNYHYGYHCLARNVMIITNSNNNNNYRHYDYGVSHDSWHEDADDVERDYNDNIRGWTMLREKIELPLLYLCCRLIEMMIIYD